MINPTIAIVDYGSGNLRSAEKALARTAHEIGLGQNVVVTAEPGIVAKAERIVLPGVGAFADCMAGLSGIPGMIDALQDAVLKRGAPFLGVCVGMQMLAEFGREHGDHKGLGWIAGDVVKIAPSDKALKIPHMGWNTLRTAREHVLFDELAGKDLYFVHSFHVRPTDKSTVLADTDYGGTIVACVGRDNIVGTQFHPEKSQATGLSLLSRFLKWRP